jgi:hypothetical protein
MIIILSQITGFNKIKEINWKPKLMIFGFISQCISTYSANIIGPWKMNTIMNDDNEILDMRKMEVYTTYNIYELYLWLNYIISLVMFFKMEASFIFAKFIADMLIRNLILCQDLKNKEYKKSD